MDKQAGVALKGQPQLVLLPGQPMSQRTTGWQEKEKLQLGINGVEDVRNQRAHNGQGGDHHDGDQDQTEGVLNPTLATFLD